MRRMGVVAGLLLVAAAVGLFFLYSQTEVERQLRRGEWVWGLVVGIDAGADGEPQADFIAAAGVDSAGRAAVIMVPGEVAVPRDGELLPLAEVWNSEREEDLARQVEGLLEISLSYWAVVDFALFRGVVDAVGGVEVEVEEQIVYVDRSQDLYINIPAGLQRLDGEQALQLVRYRGYEGAPETEQDVASRQLRTVSFVDSLWQEFRGLSWGTWREVLRSVVEGASTDLSIWEAVDLARVVRDVDMGQGRVETMPFFVVDGQVLPDFVRVRQLMQAVQHDVEHLTRDRVNVAVLNGVGVRLLAHRTGLWLGERGFNVVMTGNADRQDYGTSYVLSLSDAQEKARMVADVLPDHLGVQLAEGEEWGVDRLEDLPDDVDVVMILGRGFDIGG